MVRKIKNIDKSIELLKYKDNVILIGRNSSKYKKYPHDLININYDNSIDLEEAINTICDRVTRSVKKGNITIVLSDKKKRTTPKQAPNIISISNCIGQLLLDTSKKVLKAAGPIETVVLHKHKVLVQLMVQSKVLESP